MRYLFFVSASTGAENGRDCMGGYGNLGATPVGFRCLHLGIHCFDHSTLLSWALLTFYLGKENFLPVGCLIVQGICPQSQSVS